MNKMEDKTLIIGFASVLGLLLAASSVRAQPVPVPPTATSTSRSRPPLMRCRLTLKGS